MARRYTTRLQDAEFVARRLSDATRDWKIGDACRSYDNSANTTVERVDGAIVVLANGDSMHVSKMRRAQ